MSIYRYRPTCVNKVFTTHIMQTQQFVIWRISVALCGKFSNPTLFILLAKGTMFEPQLHRSYLHLNSSPCNIVQIVVQNVLFFAHMWIFRFAHMQIFVFAYIQIFVFAYMSISYAHMHTQQLVCRNTAHIVEMFRNQRSTFQSIQWSYLLYNIRLAKLILISNAPLLLLQNLSWG
jgi:hypothetical protein